MVIGVFPLAKLGVLFVKQISKPIAKIIVNQAKKHHIFRTYIIIPPAQFFHWLEVNTKMYLMNAGTPAKVPKLNEVMAIELGANMMGELIIFSLVGTCVILEYQRSQSKEAKKEEAYRNQMQSINDRIEMLQKQTEQQNANIQYLISSVEQLAKHTKYKLTSNFTLTEQQK